MCVCDTSWSEYNNIVGLANLRKEFNVCSLQANQVSSCSKCVITSGVSIILMQIDHLVGWVKNSFTSLAMMDYPYPTSFLAPLPAFPVREACHLLLQYPNTVTGLAKAAGQPFHLHVYSTSHFCVIVALFYSGSSNDSSCFDIFTQFVSCADPTGCGIGPNSLAWDYQVPDANSYAAFITVACCRRVQRWHCLVSPTMWLTCSLRLYTILLLIVLIAGVWLRGETGPGLNYGAMVSNV